MMCWLQVELSSAYLSKPLRCTGRSAPGSRGMIRDNLLIVHALALTICGAEIHCSGVLATAGAVCGNAFAPSGTITARRAIYVEERLVEAGAFGGSEGPALGYCDGIHGCYAARLNLLRPSWPKF